MTTDRGVLCPECGYDLRGTDVSLANARCSECGFDLSKLHDKASRIPWAHRREIGRVRAWWRTVWKFTKSSGWIGLEMSRPVSLSDARRFWLVTSSLLSLFPIGAFVTIWRDAGSLRKLSERVVPDPSSYTIFFARAPLTWPQLDLAVPWAAGLAVPGLMIVMIWLGTVMACGAPTYLYHPRRLDSRSGARAVALGYYNCATLVVPALFSVAIALLAMALDSRSSFTKEFEKPLVAIVATMTLLTLVGLLLSVGRFALSLQQTMRCGNAWALAMLPMPTVLACVSYALTVAFVPWVVGYVRLTVEVILSGA